jgi:GT2 family glycosyltransferase
MSAFSVSFIIVNFNAGELCGEAVESVKRAAGNISHEIFVVDNASTDESMRTLHRLEGVVLLENTVNLGFGAACNQAAALARGDLIWLLNPDAELTELALLAVLNAFDDDPTLAAASPPVISPDGTPQRVAQADPALATYWKNYSLLSDFKKEQTDSIGGPDSHGLVTTDWLMGASLCLRRSWLEKLPLIDSPESSATTSKPPPMISGQQTRLRPKEEGTTDIPLALFDPRYFLYFEDADLCRRLRDVGCRIALLPGAEPVRHLAQQSSAHSPDTKRATLVAFYRSLLQYADRWWLPADRAALPRSIRRDLRLRLLLLPVRRNIPADLRTARRTAYREILGLLDA